MSEGPDPSSRLAGIGLALPPYTPPAEPMMANCVRAGSTIFVEAVPPILVEGMEIPRLGQSDNVKLEGLDMEALGENHPLNLAMFGVRTAVLRSLSIAAHAAGEDLNRIKLCTRASLMVRTGPNFERLGLVAMPIRRIMTEVFGQPPAVATAGVSALPAGTSVALEAEYALADA